MHQITSTLGEWDRLHQLLRGAPDIHEATGGHQDGQRGRKHKVFPELGLLLQAMGVVVPQALHFSLPQVVCPGSRPTDYRHQWLYIVQDVLDTLLKCGFSQLAIEDTIFQGGGYEIVYFPFILGPRDEVPDGATGLFLELLSGHRFSQSEACGVAPPAT